jgi:hypothetical protein
MAVCTVFLSLSLSLSLSLLVDLVGLRGISIRVFHQVCMSTIWGGVPLFTVFCETCSWCYVISD